jgi:NTE family protein
MKSKRDIYDFSFSTKGLIKGNKLEEYIIGYFKNENIKFEDLKIELSINATDIVHGEEVVFNSGPLIPAIMASVSYPGFFTTRKIADRLCVDGGVVNPLPVDLLPEVDYAIIIDVSSQDMEINQDSNIKDLVLQSTWTMQKIIAEKSIESYKKPYIILKPDVTRIGVLDFKNSERIIKTGEEEALKRIDKIKEDLK